MDLREKILHNRKNYRVIGAWLGLLLLLSAALFYLAQRGRDLPAALVTNRVLLFVLWYAVVILILVVVFVLLRNLIKLLVERRHRVLGSTFKFKLVATYIGLSLIPVLLLFALATELLQGSIDRWFNTPVAPVLERGNAVAQALYDRIERTNLRDASLVSSEIRSFDLDDPAERPRLTRRMQELLQRLGLDLLAVYEGREFVHAILNSQSGIPDLPEPERSFLEQAAKEGTATAVVAPPGKRGSLLMAAVAAARPQGEAEGAEPRAPVIVIAGALLDPVLSEQREKLVQDRQAYRQLQVQKDDLRASHILLFAMVT